MMLVLVIILITCNRGVRLWITVEKIPGLGAIKFGRLHLIREIKMRIKRVNLSENMIIDNQGLP